MQIKKVSLKKDCQASLIAFKDSINTVIDLEKWSDVIGYFLITKPSQTYYIISERSK